MDKRPNPDLSSFLVKAVNHLLQQITRDLQIRREFRLGEIPREERPLLLTITWYERSEFLAKLDFEEASWKDYVASVTARLKQSRGYRNILGIQKRIKKRYPGFGFHVFATTKARQSDVMKSQIRWLLTNNYKLQYDQHFLWELQISEEEVIQNYDEMYLEALRIKPYETPVRK